MAADKEHELTIGGARFRVRDAGQGEAVIWLGGSLPPALGARLVERGRVIELHSSETSMADARAIGDAVASLGVDRFAIIAQGDTAPVALRLALQMPQALRAVAMLGPRLIAANGEAAAAIDPALVAQLASIKAPCLAIFGTKDECAPPEAARYYRARIPGCNLIFVYDATEAMARERPEAVAELLLDFLDRGDHFIVRREEDLLYP